MLAAILGLATLAASLVALAIGASGVGLGGVLDALLGTVGIDTPWTTSALERRILLHIRLPRVVLGVTVGASLAVSGAAMQALFRNPLADPGLIGVAGGAALGAVA